MGKTAASLTNRRSHALKKACSKLIVLAPLALTACGHVNYSTERENFLSDSTKTQGSRTLGNIYVNFSDSEINKPYTMEINRFRGVSDVGGHRDKGYALNAPLYTNVDDTHLNYTVAKTRDRHWFSGLELKFEF